MSFQTELPIRFGDEDHAQIVYYPRFFHLFHCALEDFFAASGRPLRTMIEEDRVGWPVVQVQSSFKRPIRFGDVFVVDVWVPKVGSKSVSFAYRGRKKGEPHDATTAEITCACVNLRNFQSQEVPEAYRRLFEQHQSPPEE